MSVVHREGRERRERLEDLDAPDALDALDAPRAAATVLVVHDQRLLALGLTMLLREASGGRVAVVGWAGNADLHEAVKRLRPNLVLVCLGSGKGFDVVRRIKASWPQLHVVVQSAPEDAATATACVCAGVAGIVSTDAEPTAVVSALLTVIGGMTVLPPWLLPALPPRASLLCEVDLNHEEGQLWRLLTRGWTNDAIGHELHLSDRTLKRRICLLLCKLAVTNRVEAAALGGRLGLLDDPTRSPLLRDRDPTRITKGDGNALFH